MTLGWAQLVLSARERALFGQLVPRPPEVPTRRRLPALRYPVTSELLYAETLLAMSRECSRAIREQLVPRLGELIELYTRDVREESEIPEVQRADAKSKDSAALFAEVIRDLQKLLGVTAAEAEKTALSMIVEVQQKHAYDFSATYGQILPVNPLVGREKWLTQAMRVATRENVDLIKSIPDQQLKHVERIVSNGIVNGSRVEALADELYQRFDVSDSRAMLIARDQVGKWHGSLQRLRQVDAGVHSYEWSASGDERVRAKHRERDGKVFRWDSPPDDGHPGIPVQCRCVAIPVFDDSPAQQTQTTAQPIKPVAPPPTPSPPARAPKAPKPQPQASVRRLAFGQPGEDIAQAASRVRAMVEAELPKRPRGASLGPELTQEVVSLQQRVSGALGLPVHVPIKRVERLANAAHERTWFGGMREDGTLELSPLLLSADQRHEKPLHTMVHEMVHTMGGTTSKAYRGRALRVEEAITEELAHSYLGWTDKSARATPPALRETMTVAHVAEAKRFAKEVSKEQAKGVLFDAMNARGTLFKATEGSYTGYRESLYQIVSAVTGEHDFAAVRMHVREAGRAWKQEKYDTPGQALTAFVDALAKSDAEREIYKALLHSDLSTL